MISKSSKTNIIEMYNRNYTTLKTISPCYLFIILLLSIQITSANRIKKIGAGSKSQDSLRNIDHLTTGKKKLIPSKVASDSFSSNANKFGPIRKTLNIEDLERIGSRIQKMSLAEKIGQLFMISISGVDKTQEEIRIKTLIDQYKIGGIVFLRGTPEREHFLSEYFQKVSKLPLLITTDAENGLGMRMDSLISFPKELTLGAVQDNGLIYKMGLEIARESRILGINMDLAPVLDVNTTAFNPIINERSFGEDPKAVAIKGIAFMKGLQDGGVLAIAKHFPGHGNTFEDSHLTLPTVKGDKEVLDSINIYPFRSSVQYGISGIMTGHLFVPGLDSSENSAASLSRPIITGILRDNLKFDGLVITDAMNMGGVSQFSSLDKEVRALSAGNDMILFPENLEQSFNHVYLAYKNGKLPLSELNAKVRRILIAKYRLGLFENSDQRSDASNASLIGQINTPYSKQLKENIVAASLTLLGNQNKALPLRDFQNEKMAVISIGQVKENTFQETLNKYAPVEGFNAWVDDDAAHFESLKDSLKSFSTVIVALHNLEKSEQVDYGIRSNTLKFIRSLPNHKVVLVVFGNPYLLHYFDNIPNILVAYEDNYYSEKLSAEALFGAIVPKGKLPVSVSNRFKKGAGISFMPTGRIQYLLPEDVGISSDYLKKVDSIALDGIRKKAFPGCVILAAKDGKVFYEKAFGHHTYTDFLPTKVDDLFDLASVTKISSTLLGVMKVYEQGLIELDNPVSTYLTELENSDKGKMILKDLLTHQAGLVPFIPFYVDALKTPDVFQKDSSAYYSWRVADHMYERKDYFSKTMWPRILASPLKTPGKYVYSDLSMYFMRAVLERVSHQDLKSFVTNGFYKPLGLSTTGFNPRSHISPSRIMPTENDTLFRKQLLVGDVHDQGAAMQDGVGGHAGLFSNASDLAILGQMLLNEGEYAGRIYLKPETVKLFNTRPYPKTSRRGLGFDKPDEVVANYPAVSNLVSPETFGHTGFTGTCIWIDPKNKFVYIFLSNRVCPDANNNEISNLSVRPKIQTVFYEAMDQAQKGEK